MYLRYYGFKDYPFSVTPDPEFLYLSDNHREAFGHLLYGAGEHGGFVALIGEVGTGKTTLIRAVADSEIPDLDIALCWNPHLGVKEFVATICDELGAYYDPSADTTLKALVDRLNAHLLESHAANRRTVLIIDEAQNLSREVLEQLRLLTNLETHKHKLLRIILVGQPELGKLLARNDLRQLAQRITARFHLTPLSRAETRAYVQHRLDRADGPQHLFTSGAITVLQYVTKGVPRLINMVCERALMGGYAHARSRIGPRIVWRAATETLPGRRARRRRTAVLATLLVILLVGAGVSASPWFPRARAGQWFDTVGARTSTWIASLNITPGLDSSSGADSAAAASPDVGGAAADNSPSRESSTGERERTGSEQVATNGKVDVDASTENPAQSQKNGPAKAKQAGGDKTGEERKTPADKKQPPGFPEGNADINRLLRLWGVFGARVHSGCRTLRVGNLRCLSGKGGFSTLERYNRPALLILEHEGDKQTVLLTSIEGNEVTIVGANGARQVSRHRLLRRWTGHFRVVWRSEAKIGLVPPGTVGGAVIWLRKHLAKAQGRTPDKTNGQISRVYDKALESQVKHFQLIHGLTPDGMVGPRTQMVLNGAVSSPGSPELESRGS